MTDKFEDWFDGVEEGNFSTRSEYFYEDVDVQYEDRRRKLLKLWLEAAFSAGQDSMKDVK